MNKKNLISKVTEVLKNNGVRKPVTMPRHIFHISDDEGNNKDFVVKKTEKTVAYNTTDVASVIEACLLVIEDCIKKGEPVYFHGFGTFDVYKRSARQARHPETGELVDIEARFVPRFTFGNTLRTAARVFQSSIEDSLSSSCFEDELKEGDV